MNRASSDPPVVRFEKVAVRPALLGADLLIGNGECGVIATDAATAVILADLAQGIVAQDEGSVLVCGEDWRALSARSTYALRARIGRMQVGMNWIQNLDVDENVLLPQLDHTSRPEGEIREEAEALALQLGLGALPSSRPSDTSDLELCASACVRAFLGAPELVIVGSTGLPIVSEIRVGLGRLVHSACLRGAAVLWLGETTSASRDLPPGPRFELSRGLLVPAAGYRSARESEDTSGWDNA